MNYLPCTCCGDYHDDGTAELCVKCLFELGEYRSEPIITDKCDTLFVTSETEESLAELKQFFLFRKEKNNNANFFIKPHDDNAG